MIVEAASRVAASVRSISSRFANYGQLGREDLEKAPGRQGRQAVAVESSTSRTSTYASLLKAKGRREAVLTYGIGPEPQIANRPDQALLEGAVIGS